MRRFDAPLSKVGRFQASGKKLLLPLMAPSGSRLLAAAFRGIGVDAEVMKTYQGLALGKEFTSGKECYPCQVTLGDILLHLQEEKRRLGESFSGDNYVYFLPESEGPCRFGMYNMLQRLALDHFPDFRDVRIASVTSKDGYSASGIIPEEKAKAFRRLAFDVVTAGDVLDRITRRVRPYELRRGSTDECREAALAALEEAIESHGLKPGRQKMLRVLADAARTMRELMDPELPRRPRIGIVGEIYVRCHSDSNQHVVRLIEECGGEVVNSSVSEWFTYISYLKARDGKRLLKRALRRRSLPAAWREGRRWLPQALEYAYLRMRQKRVYGSVSKVLDILVDPSIAELEKCLAGDRHFTFDVGTETAVSIGGAMEFVHEGFNGVVNVFPFTCLPGTMATAVLKPLLGSMGIPSMECSYDGTIQPNREVAVSTFVHQARQHMERRGAALQGRA
jgi:predicted nucleotide-binding protein (sugar kinase/HSP70/actin superfamily)